MPRHTSTKGHLRKKQQKFGKTLDGYNLSVYNSTIRNMNITDAGNIHRQDVVYSCKHYTVYECCNHYRNDKVYYTVVNELMKTHRHFNDLRTAKKVCRSAGDYLFGYQEVMYLITGEYPKTGGGQND
jgi:hypothetical protein